MILVFAPHPVLERVALVEQFVPGEPQKPMRVMTYAGGAGLQLGGKNSFVIIIDADARFNIIKLANLLRTHIQKCRNSGTQLRSAAFPEERF